MGLLANKNSDKSYLPYSHRNPFRQTVQPEPPVGENGNFTGEFRAYSALKMFEYTVGKTKRGPTVKRRDFLLQFIEMDLPSMVERTLGD